MNFLKLEKYRKFTRNALRGQWAHHVQIVDGLVCILAFYHTTANKTRKTKTKKTHKVK